MPPQHCCRSEASALDLNAGVLIWLGYCWCVIGDASLSQIESETASLCDAINIVAGATTVKRRRQDGGVIVIMMSPIF